jgi:hypothetical protein
MNHAMLLVADRVNLRGRIPAMPEHYCRLKWDGVVEVIKSGDHRLMHDDLAGQCEQEDCTMAGIGGSP